MRGRIHPLSQIGLFILLMSRPPGPFSGFSMSLLAGAPVGLGIRAWGVRVVGGGPPAAPVAAPHSRGRSSSRKRPVSRTGFPNDPCALLAGRRPAVTSPRGQFARLIWT